MRNADILDIDEIFLLIEYVQEEYFTKQIFVKSINVANSASWLKDK